MESVKVIKIGGNVVDDHTALDIFLKNFATIDGAKILVHGGGKVASAIGRSLGIEPIIVDGRRVTDIETLRVVTMAYGGLINKNIVATLQGLGCNAIGLTGVDGGLVRSQRRASGDVDFGYVGDPISVNINLLTSLVGGGFAPIVAPLTLSDAGQILNTNADTMAQTIATAMASVADVELHYIFEMDGVLDKSGSVIKAIDSAKFAELRADGTVSGGMLPKIENALSAVKQGVRRVFIGRTVCQ